MPNQQIPFPEVASIERVVAIFEVVFRPSFPVTRIKVKVLQRAPDSFIAFPNIAIKNLETGHPEWTSGLGDRIEDARDDAIRSFLADVEQYKGDRELSEGDFEWADPACF